MKAKTRAKLAKNHAKATGTFADPIRLYDRPIWFDVWFLVGLILTVPDILIGALILFKADFSWDLASRSVSGYLFLLGQTIVLFGLGSVLPVFIRRSMRRGRLSIRPSKQEPGFYADPVRKNSQRYWDGSAWTDELRAPYKREVGRTLFLCGVFFALSLLLGLGSAMKGLNAEKVKQAYDVSSVLALQLAQEGGAVATPGATVDSAADFAMASSLLNEAIAAFPRKEGEQTQVDGIDLVLYESYATTFMGLAERVDALSAQIQACASLESPCARAAVSSANAVITKAAQSLPAVQAREEIASQ